MLHVLKTKSQCTDKLCANKTLITASILQVESNILKETLIRIVACPLYGLYFEWDIPA
jgi:hypothetical protein